MIDTATSMITRAPFGTLADGRPVTRYQLTNPVGTRIAIIDLGATITQLFTRDRQHQLADIVLGFDDPAQYLGDNPFFGAIIGRCANRIARGRFTREGKTYQLTTNDGAHHLHGGACGFDQRLWRAHITPDNRLTLTLTSADGDQGYPGNLKVRVSYQLTDDNRLIVDYAATTDRATPVNLTQHSYFNLAGHASGNILAHQLTLNADHYLPVDAMMIPTGQIKPVAETPFDFTRGNTVGAYINARHEQLLCGNGYDHNWVLNNKTAADQPAAIVVDPGSGRTLTLVTDQPGIQFYCGNSLDGRIRGKDLCHYHHRQGFCLETQHFPDSPNQPHFPSVILLPGDHYRSRTSFHFGVLP